MWRICPWIFSTWMCRKCVLVLLGTLTWMVGVCLNKSILLLFSKFIFILISECLNHWWSKHWKTTQVPVIFRFKHKFLVYWFNSSDWESIMLYLIQNRYWNHHISIIIILSYFYHHFCLCHPYLIPKIVYYFASVSHETPVSRYNGFVK